MALLPQMPGQVLAQPVPALLPKTPIFGEEFEERQPSLDSASVVFKRYFGRVHKKYKSMDTTNIENLANRLLQEQDQTLMNLVKDRTLLRDTFLHRVFEIKTPLGQVLQELQNSQESPNRNLLSRKTFNEAEEEAIELTKKEVALATKKKERKQISDEISSVIKRQTAVEKIGPELQISIPTTARPQLPSATSLSNGKFLITWLTWPDISQLHNIVGQIYNADGTKYGTQFSVNTYTAGIQWRSSAASLSDNKFVVTWESAGQDGNGDGIFGQIFNADGTKYGTEFPVNTYTTGDQRLPSVMGLSNGKFVITWACSDRGNVYGQIFNANGAKSGMEFQINTYTSNSQSDPQSARLNNGKFVVAWVSDGQDGYYTGVFGQIFNADGTKYGSEFQVNTHFQMQQDLPSITSLTNGKFVITWNDIGQGGIFGQMFNADGTRSGSEFPVVQGGQLSSVAPLSNGQFVVSWQSGGGQDGSDGGVFGQIFNADRTKYGSVFQINTFYVGDQESSSAASLGNDEFVVVWETDNKYGGGDGAYGQIFRVKTLPTISSSPQSNTEVSGAVRQTTSIALTALGWLAKKS